MQTVTTGRRLDDAGKPMPGTGFTVDADGPVAAKLAERVGPLISHPGAGVWSTALVEPADSGGEYERRLVVLAPSATGSGEHAHAGSGEAFSVVAGEVTVTTDGTDHALAAGRGITVPADVPHSFRNDGDAVASFVVDIRPPNDTRAVIRTVFGRAHDDPDAGPPGLLGRLLLTAAFGGDTAFTPPRPWVQRALAPGLRPVARARYRADVERYATDAFWERTVEQPDL